MVDKDNRFRSLIRYWKGRKAEVRQPASEEALEAFQLKYRIQLSDDFRLYLRTADGMESSTSDNTNLMFSFWQLDRIIPARSYFLTPERIASSGDVDLTSYFCFADYMIGAEVFMLRMSSDPSQPTTVLGWKGAKKADSFLEFVTKYLVDPESLISK